MAMPPDYPPQLSALPRSRVVEVMTRATDDALRQLRAAGIPETEALAVIQRFSTFSVQVLRALDSLYREYEQLLAQNPDRTQAHQEWFDTKVGGMLLNIEAFIAALVAEAINKAKEDYRSELAKPREVISVPPARPARWEEALHDLGRLFHHPAVYWSVGLSVWVLVWLATGANLWALVAIGLTAFVVFLFEKPGLLLLLTVGGVCVLLLVFVGVVG